MSMVKEEAEVVMRSPLPTEAPEVHFHFCCDIILLASGVTYWFSLVVMMPFAAIGIGTNSFDAAPITALISAAVECALVLIIPLMVGFRCLAAPYLFVFGVLVGISSTIVLPILAAFWKPFIDPAYVFVAFFIVSRICFFSLCITGCYTIAKLSKFREIDQTVLPQQTTEVVNQLEQ